MEYNYDGYCNSLSEGDIIVTADKKGNCDFTVVSLGHNYPKKYTLMRLDTMEILLDKCTSENLEDLIKFVNENYGIEIIVPYNYVNISY